MRNGEFGLQGLPSSGSCNALLLEPDEGYRVAIDACLRLAGCEAEHATMRKKPSSRWSSTRSTSSVIGRLTD